VSAAVTPLEAPSYDQDQPGRPQDEPAGLTVMWLG
jgi:hypothetical protein